MVLETNIVAAENGRDLSTSPGRPVPSGDQLNQCLRSIARAAGDLATYCDKVEHNEPTDTAVVLRSAERLRTVGEYLAVIAKVPLRDCYARRLHEFETGHVLASADAPSTWQAVVVAETARELQLAQQRHDRYYHPDIFGLSKQDQLRHYTMHVTKIIGSLAEVCSEPDRWREFEAERLPDLVLFGVKISTVAGEELGDVRLPAAFS
jgi:hypothetical protein